MRVLVSLYLAIFLMIVPSGQLMAKSIKEICSPFLEAVILSNPFRQLFQWVKKPFLKNWDSVFSKSLYNKAYHQGLHTAVDEVATITKDLHTPEQILGFIDGYYASQGLPSHSLGHYMEDSPITRSVVSQLKKLLSKKDIKESDYRKVVISIYSISRNLPYRFHEALLNPLGVGEEIVNFQVKSLVLGHGLTTIFDHLGITIKYSKAKNRFQRILKLAWRSTMKAVQFREGLTSDFQYSRMPEFLDLATEKGVAKALATHRPQMVQEFKGPANYERFITIIGALVGLYYTYELIDLIITLSETEEFSEEEIEKIRGILFHDWTQRELKHLERWGKTSISQQDFESQQKYYDELDETTLIEIYKEYLKE